jgi:hypothetical protein
MLYTADEYKQLKNKKPVSEKLAGFVVKTEKRKPSWYFRNNERIDEIPYEETRVIEIENKKFKVVEKDAVIEAYSDELKRYFIKQKFDIIRIGDNMKIDEIKDIAESEIKADINLNDDLHNSPNASQGTPDRQPIQTITGKEKDFKSVKFSDGGDGSYTIESEEAGEIKFKNGIAVVDEKGYNFLIKFPFSYKQV